MRFTDRRSAGEQAVSGLWIAAKALLVIFTGGALVGGIATLRQPQAVLPESFVGHHPLTPWLFVVIATIILVFTIDRWVTILPGILSYSAFGGLFVLITGHYRKMQVSRSIGLAFILYAIAAICLLVSFANRRLTLIDRFALLVFVFSLAFSMTIKNSDPPAAFGIGVAVLFIAWLIDRIPRSGHDQARSSLHHSRRDMAGRS